MEFGNKCHDLESLKKYSTWLSRMMRGMHGKRERRKFLREQKRVIDQLKEYAKLVLISGNYESFSGVSRITGITRRRVNETYESIDK